MTSEFISSFDVPRLSEAHFPMLITGVAGVAGYNAFHYFRQRYGDQVVGVRPVNNWPLRSQGIVGCDLESPGDAAGLFQQHRFRTVLSCGGSCHLKGCELDPAMAERVNVTAVERLIEQVNQHQCRFVHLSIDLVFSGAAQGGYLETDPPDPVTVYGKTMVRAEQRIAAACPEAALLRISLPMGVSFNGHAGAIDWIQSRFAKQKPATLYFDEIRTPTYVECLNETLDELLGSQAKGLFHAGGSIRHSLYEIAQIVNRVGGYAPELLIGCPRLDAGPIPPRAGNVSMDSTRLSQFLGRSPFAKWPLNPEHRPTHREWHYERPESGGPDQIRRYLYQRNWLCSHSSAGNGLPSD